MKFTKVALSVALIASASAATAAPLFYSQPWGNSVESSIRGNTVLLNDHQNQITQNRVDSETRDAQLGDRISSVDSDLQSTKLGVIVTNEAVQQNNTAIQGLTARADQTDTMLADHEQRITANADAVATKVSQTEFSSDQQRQDVAISGKVDQSAYDTDKAKQARTDDVQTGQIEVTNQRIDETRATAADNKAAQAVTDAAQDSTLADHDSRITSNTDAITAESSTRTSQFNTLSAGVKQAQDTGAYAQSRADAAYAHTEANKAALDATNKRVSQNTADIANHETRIQGLEQQTNSKFADLNKQVDDNRKRASAGIAGVAAMANIPQVTNTQSFSVGAGVGNTDGESALAVGFSARATENTVVKASVSNDTQHNFVVGAGVSYGW